MKTHPTAEVDKSAKIGECTFIWHHTQIRENVKIGKNCVIGKNVYIDFGVSIGDNVKIQNNCSIYHGTTIESGVFVGPHVIFTNDKIPRAINADGTLKKGEDWEVGKIKVSYGASIGAGCIILPGVIIGKFSLIGAGSVVTKNVEKFGLYYGGPASMKGFVCKCGKKIEPDSTCRECCIKLSKEKEIKEL